jgi:uncharacterized protein (TIGR02231 family)
LQLCYSVFYLYFTVIKKKTSVQRTHNTQTMRKLLILLLFTAPVATILGQNEITISAKPNKVTVYLQQALIQSQIKTTLPAGANTLIIENIASSIDPATIQLAGLGDITILSTKYGQNFTSPAKNSAHLKLLNDSLTIYSDYLRVAQLNLDMHLGERDLLKANYAVNNSTTGSSPEKVKAMADFYRNRMADINGLIFKTEKQINFIKQRQGKIQNQIKEFNEQRPSVGQIQVNLLAASRTNASLELSYVAYGAGWSPVYDIRAKDSKSQIALGYKAQVWQQSGIDWEQVQLQLSTANPAMGGNKPEMGTLWVDFYQQPVYYKRGMQNKEANMDVQSSAAPSPAMVQEEAVQTAANHTTVQENSLAVNFDISLPYTINHGGQAQTVDIQNHNLDGNFMYYAAPKLDNDAFLTAQISGWEKYNLLPGIAKVFFEGNYVGETYINAANTADTLKVGMGRDKKIIIKREKVADFTSKKTLGQNIRESYGFKTTIRNTKKEAIVLLLEDQIPVSQNSDIEVLDKSLNGGSENAETGKVIWQITLKPNETKIIDLKYTIKYPKGKVVTGQQ